MRKRRRLLSYRSDEPPTLLVRRIERQRGKAGAATLRGDIDETGFRLFHIGGFTQRSFIVLFDAHIEPVDDGARIHIKFLPPLTELIIFSAISALGIAVAAKPDFRLAGIITALVAPTVYGLLGWMEWRVLEKLLRSAGCSRLR